jgi:hypothetical protein
VESFDDALDGLGDVVVAIGARDREELLARRVEQRELGIEEAAVLLFADDHPADDEAGGEVHEVAEKQHERPKQEIREVRGRPVVRGVAEPIRSDLIPAHVGGPQATRREAIVGNHEPLVQPAPSDHAGDHDAEGEDEGLPAERSAGERDHEAERTQRGEHEVAIPVEPRRPGLERGHGSNLPDRGARERLPRGAGRRMARRVAEQG